ncbi:MFS transporter [Motilibacter aurantiacus]|uniref:MFS transporter n=1 Tax=Motilibacter aurantiacus TaxID=2714955 RepID=UPI00140C26A8|nr:MFS transporter [Motilibacter aurantiacus]NHC43782.1 MFS transporter [Motilibacter aurantiacus]
MSAALALVLRVMVAGAGSPRTVIVATVSGAFIGVNDTSMRQAVTEVPPVERPVASSAYGFLRVNGGGLAACAAGELADYWALHVPFYVRAGAFLAAGAFPASGHRPLEQAGRAAEAPVAQPDVPQPGRAPGTSATAALGREAACIVVLVRPAPDLAGAKSAPGQQAQAAEPTTTVNASGSGRRRPRPESIPSPSRTQYS